MGSTTTSGKGIYSLIRLNIRIIIFIGMAYIQKYSTNRHTNEDTWVIVYREAFSIQGRFLHHFCEKFKFFNEDNQYNPSKENDKYKKTKLQTMTLIKRCFTNSRKLESIICKKYFIYLKIMPLYKNVLDMSRLTRWRNHIL